MEAAVIIFILAIGIVAAGFYAIQIAMNDLERTRRSANNSGWRE